MTRLWQVALFGTVVSMLAAGAVLGAHLHAKPLLIRNVTPSMPLGLYRLTDHPMAVGVVVAVPQPAPARAYLRGLGFPADALLLKRVVAQDGQVVCASADRVMAGSLKLVRVDRDRLGQPLPKWSGCRRLASNEVFLRGDGARSFDSRYFGPVPRSDVVGVYERLP